MAPGELTQLVAAVHGVTASPHAQVRALAAALGECVAADSLALTIRPPAGIEVDSLAVESGWTYHWKADGGGSAQTDDAATATIELSDSGGHILAALAVAPPRSGDLIRDWVELRAVLVLLVSDLAAQLTAEQFARLISRSAAELTDARLAAAAKLEQLRYQLERDLHDGAQHHMVALQMALAMVEHQLGLGDPAAAVEHVDRLRQLLTGTEDVLYATATGLLAQTLAENGLAAALAARLSLLAYVTVDIDPLLTGQRYPSHVETAVYLACLEAVSNAYKHAPGATVTVTLRTLPDGLGFEVADTGPGFPADRPMPLRHLDARLASVGGRLWVVCGPVAGTRVTGYVKV
jgi:signal transduction histidine kinase